MEKQHEHKTVTACREATCLRLDAICVSTRARKVMVRMQSLLAGFMVSVGFVGMIYFTHIGDPITHRPAFYILFATAGCLLFLGQHKSEAKL